MKYFKVTLSELAGEQKIHLYLVPQEDDFDENYTPIFNEEIVRNLKETKKFAKKIKSNVLHLKYELCEISGSAEAEIWADFADIENGENIKVIAENDFQIDITKKLQIYGKDNSADKTPFLPFVIVFMVIAAVAVLFISRQRENITSDVSNSAEISETPEVSTSEIAATKPITYDITSGTEAEMMITIIDITMTSVPAETSEIPTDSNGRPNEPERTKRYNTSEETSESEQIS
jgi:hypothetical protein